MNDVTPATITTSTPAATITRNCDNWTGDTATVRIWKVTDRRLAFRHDAADEVFIIDSTPPTEFDAEVMGESWQPLVLSVMNSNGTVQKIATGASWLGNVTFSAVGIERDADFSIDEHAVVTAAHALIRNIY